uniref:Uncharacterized protein n=1 Tax=Mycolicibacterium phage phi1_186018 TaxID=3236641 RepID=A0AB39AKN1_9CAUD
MPTTNADRAVVFGAGLLIGLAVGMPVGALITAEPAEHRVAEPTRITDTAPSISYAEYAYAATGTEPAEDDPAFDCRIHGNRICGPGNSQGVPPGQYRDVQPGTTLVSLLLP